MHRLDRDTTGLLVFARTLSAKRELKNQFRHHNVERRYWALVEGQMETTTITSRLITDRGDGRRGSVESSSLGRVATTHVKALERLPGATLVECRLETGRTHQIRIHLGEEGHALLGERVYGARGRSSASEPPLPESCCTPSSSASSTPPPRNPAFRVENAGRHAAGARRAPKAQAGPPLVVNRPGLSQLLGFLRSASTNVRAIGVAVVLALGIALFAWVGHGHYPIPDWLFWHYAACWVAVLVWAAGCLGTGAFLLERAFRVRLPLLEHVLVPFTLGLFAFEWLMFLLGAAGLYRKSTFFLAPILPLAIGLPALGALWVRTKKLLRRRPPRLTPLTGLALAFGLLGLGMVYFLVLTPENVQFDSRWKHMAIAEDWVVHGGIRRATEGWVFSARPHMTSYLFAWAFLAPKARLFDQMLLCAHLEFFTFLVTTTSVSRRWRGGRTGREPHRGLGRALLVPGYLPLRQLGVGRHRSLRRAVRGADRDLRLSHPARVREAERVGAGLPARGRRARQRDRGAVAGSRPAGAARRPLDRVRGQSASRKKPELLRSAWLIPLTALGIGLLVSIPFWLKKPDFSTATRCT